MWRTNVDEGLLRRYKESRPGYREQALTRKDSEGMIQVLPQRLAGWSVDKEYALSLASRRGPPSEGERPTPSLQTGWFFYAERKPTERSFPANRVTERNTKIKKAIVELFYWTFPSSPSPPGSIDDSVHHPPHCYLYSHSLWAMMPEFNLGMRCPYIQAWDLRLL